MSSIHTKRAKQKLSRRRRAHFRVRNKVRGTAAAPRLAVFKSARHIYAQLIDDEAGKTLIAASSLDPEVKGKLSGGSGNKAAARLVGETVGQRAKGQGIERAVFDRGGFIFHGKIKEVAEGARAEGLSF